ncbi:MAG: Wzz/FepE/Etk N-terminal domain-containing protein [Terriglobales bacterium]
METKSRIEIPSQLPLQEVALEEVEFREFRENSIERLRLLWNQRSFLAKVAGLGLIVGVLIAFAIPKEYRASVQLMPPDNQSNAGMLFAALAAKGGGGGLGAIAGDLLGIKNSGALFIGVLRSRTVADRVVQRFDLRRVYRTKLEEDARAELAENTALSEDRKSGIVTITVSDRDPKRVAAIAQAYVDELDRLVAELSTSAAHRERVFLEERLKEVKQELDQAAHDLSQFSSKTAAIDIKEQGRAMVEGAAVLQGQLIAAESELKGLETIYTGNKIRVRSVQARITELQRQLDKLGGTSTAATLQPDATGDSLYPSIRQLPLLGVTYFDLYRRNKILEVVYETLTQQYELSKVEEAKEIPSVKVLDAAIVPERKSFPPRLLLVALCGLVALAGAMLWIFARLRWERVDPADPGKILAREIFTSVNSKMPWATPNGSGVQAMTHSVWTRMVRRRDSRRDAE